MKRQLIWCLSLGIVTVAGALWWLGFRPITIAYALLMIICPAIIIWGAIHIYRDSRHSSSRGERLPHSAATTHKHNGIQ